MHLTIGEKIALLRKARDITQTELAEYLFLAPQAVSRWETGNGAPDIALLPKIATFFGVSIDELFGVTSLERAEDLVWKYSVLRDDRSFQEAMECVNSQLQTLAAARASGTQEGSELEQAQEELEAKKLHLWIQQGREAFKRAYAMADAFVEKTEGKPEHPWYRRMRLQKNQLCIQIGKSQEALASCQKDFEENPSTMTLHFYLSLLNDLHRYEEILAIQEQDGRARALIFPPAKENLDIWQLIMRAASETGDGAFIERQSPQVLNICSEQEAYPFLRCLLGLYQRENRKEELLQLQQRLLALLPKMSFNRYFEEVERKKIEQAGTLPV